MSENVDAVRNAVGAVAEMAGFLMAQLEKNGFDHGEAVATASKVVVGMLTNATRREDDEVN